MLCVTLEGLRTHTEPGLPPYSSFSSTCESLTAWGEALPSVGCGFYLHRRSGSRPVSAPSTWRNRPSGCWPGPATAPVKAEQSPSLRGQAASETQRSLGHRQPGRKQLSPHRAVGSQMSSPQSSQEPWNGLPGGWLWRQKSLPA